MRSSVLCVRERKIWKTSKFKQSASQFSPYPNSSLQLASCLQKHEGEDHVSPFFFFTLKFFEVTLFLFWRNPCLCGTAKLSSVGQKEALFETKKSPQGFPFLLPLSMLFRGTECQHVQTQASQSYCQERENILISVLPMHYQQS